MRHLTLNETFLAVLVGLVALSVAVTVLGSWLRRRTIDPVQQQRLALVNSRMRASWSIVALFSVAFALGTGALLFVFALASFFALRNFVSLTPIRPADHWALVLAFYVITPLHYVLIGIGYIGTFTVFIPVYVFLLLPVVMALKQDNERYLERVAKVQWGLMICVYCISHAPARAAGCSSGSMWPAAATRQRVAPRIPAASAAGVRPSLPAIEAR